MTLCLSPVSAGSGYLYWLLAEHRCYSKAYKEFMENIKYYDGCEAFRLELVGSHLMLPIDEFDFESEC